MSCAAVPSHTASLRHTITHKAQPTPAENASTTRAGASTVPRARTPAIQHSTSTSTNTNTRMTGLPRRICFLSRSANSGHAQERSRRVTARSVVGGFSAGVPRAGGCRSPRWRGPREREERRRGAGRRGLRRGAGRRRAGRRRAGRRVALGGSGVQRVESVIPEASCPTKSRIPPPTRRTSQRRRGACSDPAANPCTKRGSPSACVRSPTQRKTCASTSADVSDAGSWRASWSGHASSRRGGWAISRTN